MAVNSTKLWWVSKHHEEETLHILVTNDDGVFAPGLLALVEAIRPLAAVSVVAPERN
jgi:hypothetical protein